MTSASPIRVLIEPSDYVLRNVGDMAMMEVAATRLVALWPDADIRVLSHRPSQLPSYGPNVTPLDSVGREIWLRTSLIPGSISRALPSRIRRGADRWHRFLRVHTRRPMHRLIRWRLAVAGRDSQPLSEYLGVLESADLVLATGMGGITDVFPGYAYDLLETLDSASRLGAVTAMMGQGMGPIADRRLRRYTAAVLRRVDLIALREERAGRPLLERDLGVDPARITTTGDDAIELGFDRRPDRLGVSIGVNLRISGYSGVTESVAAAIGEQLRAAAALMSARLVPIPISTVSDEDDRRSIERFVTGAVPSDLSSAPNSIDEVLTALADCRLVVTGSYHAAVFALSMGVPAVGLAASPYYVDKFLGLADQFPSGCEVVHLRSAVSTTEVRERVTDLWRRAETMRPLLQLEATRQLERGRQAYAEVQALVDRRAEARHRGGVRYGTFRLGMATLFRRLSSRSDLTRWANLDNLDPDWDERTQIIAELIRPGSRVLEFGAGRRHLATLLDSSATYLPSDLVRRSDDTFVADLNRRPLPALRTLKPDVVVFAGVLEYLARLPDVPKWLTGEVSTCIASYECATSARGSMRRPAEVARRWRTGWVNTYTESELVEMFGAAGFDCAQRRTWSTPQGDERIFVFEHEDRP
jgi:polysaccharide pyruvyl transferase WcaK-like protein